MSQMYLPVRPCWPSVSISAYFFTIILELRTTTPFLHSSSLYGYFSVRYLSIQWLNGPGYESKFCSCRVRLVCKKISKLFFVVCRCCISQWWNGSRFSPMWRSSEESRKPSERSVKIKVCLMKVSKMKMIEPNLKVKMKFHRKTRKQFNNYQTTVISSAGPR